jgi:uncharacterized protein (TIGR02266 family)
MSQTPEAEVLREERTEAQISQIGPSQHEHRREHARFKVDLDVNLGSEHNFYAGFAENLSAGGVFVATHLVKPVGSQIELSIKLADSEAVIRGTGEVRWIREYNEASDTPPGMGIRFTSVDPGATDAIEAFLASREPLFFDDD